LKTLDNGNPKVSIIVPAYNVEPFLRACLDSAIHQTLNDIEIVCINDGSADRSLAVLREYEKRDPRVLVLDQRNEGVSSARNAGLGAARGEYIRFLDGDEQLPLDSCEILYRCAQKEKPDILVSAAAHVARDGSRKTVNLFPTQRFDLRNTRERREAFSKYLCFGTPNQFFRSKAVSNIRFKPFSNGEDYLFYMEALVRAETLSVLGEIGYIHFRREDSASQKRGMAKLASFLTARKESLDALVKAKDMGQIEDVVSRKILGFAVGDFILLSNEAGKHGTALDEIYFRWTEVYRPLICRATRRRYCGEAAARMVFKLNRPGLYSCFRKIIGLYLWVKLSFVRDLKSALSFRHKGD
jgi:glycosyltransferase involved in cell wall biosynthesis